MTEKKVALITGGARGIGLACAVELAKSGCIIIITGSSGNCDEALAQIKTHQTEVEYYQFDISNSTQVEENISKIIEKYGKIDILVNNAGITKDNLLIRMTEEQWQDVININLTGTYNVTKNVAKHMMKARSGSIVNLSSVVGISGNAGQVNYSASKAGLIGMTKSLAKELGSRGIRVNAVAPGFIKTSMTENLDCEKILPIIPLKRLGEVEDVAKVVKFLSIDANYITGQVLRVDGGLMI